MQSEKKQFNYLLICLFVSLFLHLGGIYLIQKYSLWFYSPIKESLVSEEKPSLSKLEKTKILKQVVDVITKEKKEIAHTPLLEDSTDFSTAPDLSTPLKNKEHPMAHPSFDPIKWTEERSFARAPRTENPLSDNKKEIIDRLLSSVQSTGFKKVEKTGSHSFQCKNEELSSYQAKNPFFPKLDSSQRKKIEKVFNEQKQQQPLVFAHSSIVPPSIKKLQIVSPKLPSLDQLNTYTYEDDFEVDVVATPVEGGQYIFAITLIPKADIDLPRIRQNFFFLIDRSNSIQKRRLKVTRDAVYHGVSSIDSEDMFNIIAFDSKVDKLFPSMKTVSKEAKQQAKRFLIGQKLASFFASPNIYNCLYTVSNLMQEDGAINNIILLSNGQGLSHESLEHYFMGQWTHTNYGKASLFSIAMNDDLHVTDLELMSIINRGWLMNSSTRGGINRKLIKLLKAINKPILQDMTSTATSFSIENSLTLFTPFKQLPNLYANQPYVILGKCDQLEDFVLTLQGKNHGKWINIKKRIDLSSAKQGDEALEEQWALHEAWDRYRNYLKTADSTYLEQARMILEPYNIEPAFK
ncbi:MAG: hypothetical protein PVI40_05735 [Chlamydiota bacterium]|jgi:hypothetical protein